jgi:hypothetical protein
MGRAGPRAGPSPCRETDRPARRRSPRPRWLCSNRSVVDAPTGSGSSSSAGTVAHRVSLNGHRSPIQSLDRIAELAQTLAPLLRTRPTPAPGSPAASSSSVARVAYSDSDPTGTAALDPTRRQMRAAVRRAVGLILRAEDELTEAGDVIANDYLRLDHQEWIRVTEKPSRGARRRVSLWPGCGQHRPNASVDRGTCSTTTSANVSQSTSTDVLARFPKPRAAGSIPAEGTPSTCGNALTGPIDEGLLVSVWCQRVCPRELVL